MHSHTKLIRIYIMFIINCTIHNKYIIKENLFKSKNNSFFILTFPEFNLNELVINSQIFKHY